MRTLTSLALATALIGGLFGGISAASATGAATTGGVTGATGATAAAVNALDLPSDVSFGEASDINARSPQDRYFYYDGQFHVSYPSPPTPDANKVSVFYYDGQPQVSYSTGSKSTASAEILNLPQDVAFGEAEDISSRTGGDRYFYYDGQFHITYN